MRRRESAPGQSALYGFGGIGPEGDLARLAGIKGYV